MVRSWLLSLSLVVSVLLPAQSVRAQQFQYPIRGDDGALVANHRAPAELTRKLKELPGSVVVGNPRGTITLYEFYDLNCPYCRVASADIHEILNEEKRLRLVLVPYPVLGIPSIEAGRIEFAVAKVASPKTFYEFHRKIFAGRGVVDARRAATVVRDLNLDIAKLTEAVRDDSIIDAMKAHAKLGGELGLMATPGFVIGNVAIVGYPGKKALRGIIRAVGQCGQVVCKAG